MIDFVERIRALAFERWVSFIAEENKNSSKYYTHRVLILFSFNIALVLSMLMRLSVRFSNHQVSFPFFPFRWVFDT